MRLAKIEMIYMLSGSLGGVVLKALFLKYYPFIDNFQILDPLDLNGLNLLKPKGLQSIIGTNILI